MIVYTTEEYLAAFDGVVDRLRKSIETREGTLLDTAEVNVLVYGLQYMAKAVEILTRRLNDSEEST